MSKLHIMEGKGKKTETKVLTKVSVDSRSRSGELPLSEMERKKLDEANRRLKLKPPPTFFLDAGSQVD